MKERKLPRLYQCIIMDAVGMFSYFVPGFGEVFDAVWGFVAGLVFYYWFRTTIGSLLSGLEEVLPFSDFIPSFTIAYFYFKNKQKRKQQTISN
ncbi:MAG: hypothetical protein IKJ67_01765 [Bacteroidales bacterium]|nr:hypothetical protein [Bacteroidales bacterium]